MSTAEFVGRPAAGANPPVPICSQLWDEEALSNSCQSAWFDGGDKRSPPVQVAHRDCPDQHMEAC
jgi:hypothetical protein